MNALSKITPWPWSVVPNPMRSDGVFVCYGPANKHYAGQLPESISNGQFEPTVGELCARAPDHALLLAALIARKATLDDSDDDPAGLAVLVSGVPHKWYPASALDPFGCPILTDDLRAALKTALGLEAK